MKLASPSYPLTHAYPLKKIPEYLLYKGIQKNSRFSYEIFNIGSTKTQSQLGQMVCHKSNISLRKNYNGPILIIDFITTKIHDKGYGSILLNFAKQYSKKIGCNGYIVLKADSSFTPKRIPHLFYRKQGFSSFDPITDRKMDRFIRKNKNATYKDFMATIMHYPPNPPKTNIFKKTITNIRNYLKNRK